MQPYPNMNYFQNNPAYPPQFQQQYSNPYMERLQNLQQFQQTLQQPQINYLNGKIVDSIDVVRATDIPMDGNLYYFPKADGTEIYAKSWDLNNGKTRILTFKPLSDEQTDILSHTEEKCEFGALEPILDTLLTRFDNLENSFKEMEQSWTNLELTSTKSSTKTVNSRAKKESEE